MIILLSVSSVSYGMQFNSLELFADLIARDPLDVYAARRASEIKKTTQEINRESRAAAAKIASGSSGHHELVEYCGPIKIVRPTEKQNIPSMPKPKL